MSGGSRVSRAKSSRAGGARLNNRARSRAGRVGRVGR